MAGLINGGGNVIEAQALEDAIYTLDALHCQTDTMETIVKTQSDFVIQLKANQGHGCQESSTVMQMKAELPEELQAKWPHIRSTIEVASERQQGRQTELSLSLVYQLFNRRCRTVRDYHQRALVS